jgi:RNA polymerase sporulation-specific sigma factor
MIPELLALAAVVVKGIMLLVSYISNNAFPQPLSEEEEASYIQELLKGNEEVRNTLVEHNLRLVAHIIKKFEGTGEDIDDLISIGTIGLIKAINTFDPDKGAKLATYAARCIENEILMHLRSLKKIRGEVSLYDPIGTDKEGNEYTPICWMFFTAASGTAPAQNHHPFATFPFYSWLSVRQTSAGCFS